MRRRNWIFAALAAAGVMLALAAAPADAQEKNFEETLHAAEQGDAEAQSSWSHVLGRPHKNRSNGGAPR
ncbi:MAG: hypothetical protein ACYYKD_05305 [Rhodospirillales bacterium]